MFRTERIEGFILKKKPLLGKDDTIVLYTKELGKIRVLAKGVRAFKSKRSAHLQTGNLIKATISTQHSIIYIQSTDLVSGFTRLKTEMHIDALYLLLGVIDGLLPEHEPDNGVYRVLTHTFIALSQPQANISAILTLSLNQLLQKLGYSDTEHSLIDAIHKIEEYTDRMLPKPTLSLVPHVIM